jgi:hypothetical protein
MTYHGPLPLPALVPQDDDDDLFDEEEEPAGEVKEGAGEGVEEAKPIARATSSEVIRALDADEVHWLHYLPFDTWRSF